MSEWEAEEEGDKHIVTTNLHCCMAEINTELQRNYPLIKDKFKKLIAIPSKGNDIIEYFYSNLTIT